LVMVTSKPSAWICRMWLRSLPLVSVREALGGRLDLVADFGERTVRLPVSDTATAA
jgi:hypothetical protein